MTVTLHLLRSDTPPIAGFLGIGHTGHRKLAELQAAGRFPFRRAVFDASHLAETRSRAPAFRGGVRPAAAAMGGR